MEASQASEAGSIPVARSNYFLKFSNECKRQTGDENLANDWYEYVEYGTTNQPTIMLQRIGFTRETATYIRKHNPGAITIDAAGQPHLSPKLLESSNFNVRKEAQEIRYNVPEVFYWALQQDN